MNMISSNAFQAYSNRAAIDYSKLSYLTTDALNSWLDEAARLSVGAVRNAPTIEIPEGITYTPNFMNNIAKADLLGEWTRVERVLVNRGQDPRPEFAEQNARDSLWRVATPPDKVPLVWDAAFDKAAPTTSLSGNTPTEFYHHDHAARCIAQTSNGYGVSEIIFHLTTRREHIHHPADKTVMDFLMVFREGAMITLALPNDGKGSLPVNYGEISVYKKLGAPAPV